MPRRTRAAEGLDEPSTTLANKGGQQTDPAEHQGTLAGAAPATSARPAYQAARGEAQEAHERPTTLAARDTSTERQARGGSGAREPLHAMWLA